MKTPSTEILCGVIGGAFLMRMLDSLSSWISMALLTTYKDDILYGYIVPATSISVAAFISSAYLLTIRIKYIHWLTIIALVLSIAAGAIGPIGLLLSDSEIRQNVRLSSIAQSATGICMSIFLLCLTILVKNRKEA